ncbi:hypothetical protein E2C01_003258 [Portunus trituberculatus]|uniref:Uncharacterized protein n=1 Tax=Portunus trituberculatus TaxID=210409 RepID=A0A5B7CPB6_PORTR|nr:hypothetical protein [Portunus trituberculatus]
MRCREVFQNMNDCTKTQLSAYVHSPDTVRLTTTTTITACYEEATEVQSRGSPTDQQTNTKQPPPNT